MHELEATALAMVRPGRGILAADESTATITRRFEKLGIASTLESRCAYRELLFTAPGVADHVSGVILYDETLRRTASDGRPFPELLAELGVLPGIKVDTGAKPLAGHPDETVTEGLDGLRDRVAEYVSLGARFAKWRAVIAIGDGRPTGACLAANAHALARYAALCQEGGLVPIVEPEVLMDGDHPIERAAGVTEAALHLVFEALADQGVAPEAIVLKPNMVVAGKGAVRQPAVGEVAGATLRCLRRTVPAAVPGIAFLSGGQSPEQATAHLNAIAAAGPHPWEITFSYGRALQDPALATWRGHADQVAAAQAAFAHRLGLTAAARGGGYEPAMEQAA